MLDFIHFLNNINNSHEIKWHEDLLEEKYTKDLIDYVWNDLLFEKLELT